MHKGKLTSLVGLLLVTGCSMAPDYEKPTVAMNDVYLNAANVEGIAQTDAASSSEQQNKAPHAWWYQFHDPILDQLVARAQKQNINLQMAS